MPGLPAEGIEVGSDAGAGLGSLARAGALRALRSTSVRLQLALVLGLLGRPDDELGGSQP